MSYRIDVERAAEIFANVQRIPHGKVASYGMVGRALTSPLSGLLVGRLMRQCPDGIPWWRVVAYDGSIVTGKLDPRLGLEQRRRLEEEGVPFDGERVRKDAFLEDL